MTYISDINANIDNGTMPENVEAVSKALVGRRIISAERRMVSSAENYSKIHWNKRVPVPPNDSFNRYSANWKESGVVLTLDDGTSVALIGTADCCAHTEVERFLLDPASVDHVITGVTTAAGWTRWHILAEMRSILDLDVTWSTGDSEAYTYGFELAVGPA